MPRFQRVVVSDIPHHVVNRGNRRQDVFFQASDYEYYLEMLSLFSRIYEVRIICYCLMTNHIHLIAIPSDERSLTQMMSDVQKSYTRMINFREGWRGHLWQGRYFSCPMDEVYTTRTARYIELNPMKAKMVNNIGEYTYSSIQFHLGEKEDKLIRESYFDFSPKQWRDYLMEGLDSEKQEEDRLEIEQATGRPLGDDRFIKRLEEATDRVLKMKKSGPKNHSKFNA
ncbi:MAG: transposase [Bdellovibrionota bacterium]